MIKVDFKKDILPHIVAIAIFLVLTLILFKPIFFESKSLTQGDILQWEGGAKEILDYRAETSEEGLWTNSMFSGMPAYMVSVKWGNELIKTMHAVISFGLPHPVRIIFVSMISFYIMLLCFKVKPYLAIIGAVTFALSSYNIIGITAGHNARISAVSLMPLVMGGIHLCFTRNKWLGFSLTALALAMQMRVNHLQITYYLAFIVAIYGLLQLIHAIKQGELKPFAQRLGLLVLAAVLAVGTFFGEFYATYEYGKYSNRGQSELTQQTDQDLNEDGLSKTYAFQYSNGLADPFTLFIPNALGGNDQLGTDSKSADVLRKAGANEAQVRQTLPQLRTYWGKESPTTYYAGAIMVFLCVVGMFFVERRYVIWLVAVSILGILMSYGRNLPSLNYLLFDYFPGYNKFRSVSFTIMMPIFGIIFLGMLGLEKVIDQKLNKAQQKKLWIALGATGGLALILAIIPGVLGFGSPFDGQLPVEYANALKEDRKDLFRSDAFRAFVFIALFAGTYFLYSIKKLGKPMAFGLMILLGILDVSLVAGRFIGEANFAKSPRAQFFTETNADRYIKQNESLGDRVLNLTSSFYSAQSAYHHHTINGYHGARLRRYQELIDKNIFPEMQELTERIKNGDSNLRGFEVLNMLNTRYLIINPNSDQGALTNNSANGAAWFVDNLIKVNSPDEAFNGIGNIETKTQAIVNASEFNLKIDDPSSEGQINLIDYHPGYWKYNSQNSGDGFAVFSEIYYPKGFKVTIDGQPVEMLRANYVLRALEIPAGNHEIVFEFKPTIYSTGKIVMRIFSILVVLMFLGTVYWSLKVENITKNI
ncbi:YfhO family protein [uncultured Roseivirga sp.]|uniref:YfhO family protein n=1 Tax=uncultured Roseivirga sp. TaxID=543088 RepID=UPI0030D74855|tara:strand:+ start:364186 stop:366636 length:2451 start_codon:yes stop_codon:yes gene_type:complete